MACKKIFGFWVFAFVLGMSVLYFPHDETFAEETHSEDKVAVLITGWCSPRGYDFEYAWRSHSMNRIGDKTEYEGQPCKTGHVGEFPYQSHIGLLPWGLVWETEGNELYYDNSGIYWYDNDTDTGEPGSRLSRWLSRWP